MFLVLRHKRQQSHMCMTYSLSTLLDHFGLSIDPENTYRSIIAAGGGTGTRIRACSLVRHVNKLGLACAVNYPDSIWEALDELDANSMPCIVLTNDTEEGHAIVFIGKKDRRYWFIDPDLNVDCVSYNKLELISICELSPEENVVGKRTTLGNEIIIVNSRAAQTLPCPLCEGPVNFSFSFSLAKCSYILCPNCNRILPFESV